MEKVFQRLTVSLQKKVGILTYLQKISLEVLTLLNMDQFQLIYVGLFPLLLAITFFFVKSIKFYVKLSYFILLAILILSFRFQLLDLLWQGMHAPNMFLHRYAWIFSTLLIYISAEVLNRFKDI